MNDSGDAVQQALRFYKLDLDALTVFHDELDLAPFKVKVKVGGGTAGHVMSTGSGSVLLGGLRDHSSHPIPDSRGVPIPDARSSSRAGRWPRLLRSWLRLEPIYDRAIWKASSAEVGRATDANSSRSPPGWKVSELFERAERFYGAEWPENIPFRIGLYPIPGARGHSSAQSLKTP